MNIRTQSLAHAIKHSKTVALIAKSLQTLFYLVSGFTTLLINIPVMNRIWIERRELERMSDDQLKDIGLTRVQMQQEVGRSFMDIPVERRARIVHGHISDYQRLF